MVFFMDGTDTSTVEGLRTRDTYPARLRIVTQEYNLERFLDVFFFAGMNLLF